MNRASRWVVRVLIAALALLALVYAGDYLYVRYRMTRHQAGDPFDVLTIQPTYAIAQKNGMAEIVLGDPETQHCVHSLFAHFGLTPCWYLKRESQKPQVIGGAIIFCQAVRGMPGGSGPFWPPVLAKEAATYSSRPPAPQSTERSRSSAASQD